MTTPPLPPPTSAPTGAVAPGRRRIASPRGPAERPPSGPPPRGAGLLLIAALAGAGLPGCMQDYAGRPEPVDTVPVSGRVTVDGQPLDGAVLMFHPVDPKGKTSIGETGDDGTYEMKSYYGTTGVVPGSYRVTVSYLMGTDGKPQGIPQRYSQGYVPAMDGAEPEYSEPRETTLTAEVAPDGGRIDLDLRGPLLDPLPPSADPPPSEPEVPG